MPGTELDVQRGSGLELWPIPNPIIAMRRSEASRAESILVPKSAKNDDFFGFWVSDPSDLFGHCPLRYMIFVGIFRDLRGFSASIMHGPLPLFELGQAELAGLTPPEIRKNEQKSRF